LNSRVAGRAGASLVLLIAILAIGFWSYIGAEDGQNDEAIAPRVSAGTSASSPTESVTQSGDTPDSTGPAVSTERGVREVGSRFLGKGSLRGLLATKDGSPPPLPYVLHVGPSGSIEGREFAVKREVEMHQAEFVIEDLPLGGYDAWVVAPGMNSRRSPVLLTQNATSPYIILKVFPTGYLDGYVMNEDGRPAQDLRVELAEAFGEGRSVTQTRADGSYLIEDIRDGDYVLSFGPVDRPIVPTREVQFSAPGMHFSKVILPPTSDVKFWTTDIFGKALPDVSVRGFSRAGGRLEVTTDGSGLGWCRNVPPGKYNLTSQHEDGRKAKSAFVVTGEPNQEFWIAVK
jgi:hypothetical protein